MVMFNDGRINKEGTPDAFFNNPQHQRTRVFLSQILG